MYIYTFEQGSVDRSLAQVNEVEISSVETKLASGPGLDLRVRSCVQSFPDSAVWKVGRFGGKRLCRCASMWTVCRHPRPDETDRA